MQELNPDPLVSSEAIKSSEIKVLVLWGRSKWIHLLPCKRDGLFHSYLPLNRERVAHPKGCVVVNFGFNIWRAIPKDSYSKVNEPAYTYSAQVESVIDGDTIWTIIDLGFGTLSRQKLRLNYIDTPELGTAPGQKASRYVRRILKANPNIVICTHKHDKYTRYLADVFYLPGARSPKRILQEGIYLNQELLDKSLATVFWALLKAGNYWPQIK